MKKLTEYWKVLCAVVYLLICILDFLIIPTYITIKHDETSSYSYYRNIKEVFADDNESIRIILEQVGELGSWTPFSLRNGGLLHISFGAILTGTIIGRKKE